MKLVWCLFTLFISGGDSFGEDGLCSLSSVFASRAQISYVVYEHTEYMHAFYADYVYVMLCCVCVTHHHTGGGTPTLPLALCCK